MNELTNVQKNMGALFQAVSTGSRCSSCLYMRFTHGPYGSLPPGSTHRLRLCRSIEQRNFGRAMSRVVRVTDHKSDLLVGRSIFIGVS